MPRGISDAAPGIPVSAPAAHCTRCMLVQAVPSEVRAAGANCFLTFFRNVFVQSPWLASCSMISRVSLALVSAERLAESRISVAAAPPWACWATSASRRRPLGCSRCGARASSSSRRESRCPGRASRSRDSSGTWPRCRRSCRCDRPRRRCDRSRAPEVALNLTAKDLSSPEPSAVGAACRCSLPAALRTAERVDFSVRITSAGRAGSTP